MKVYCYRCGQTNEYDKNCRCEYLREKTRYIRAALAQVIYDISPLETPWLIRRKT